MKLTRKINYMRWICHFARTGHARFCSFNLLIVLYFSSSHYFAIFIFTPLVCACRWLCRLPTRRAKAFQQTCCKLRICTNFEVDVVLFCSWAARVNHLSRLDISGDIQDFLGAIDKQCWNFFVIHSKSNWVRNALIKSTEKFVWLPNLWLCHNETHFMWNVCAKCIQKLLNQFHADSAPIL